MMAVIFELEPAPGAMQDYLELAAALRADVAGIDGFISIERFESLSQKGKILSLSFWRDEAAIQRWRTLQAHREAQARGRNALFANYRLRVAEVVRDYGLNERTQAPQDSRQLHGA
jgi:heme-degrading monooxygenase HmoA